MARIGVVVPNYNGARYLRECLDSILAQDVAVECLVRDGGSTDESIAILREYGDRIRWISERDGGQAAAIAAGFAALDTELVGWLNSDDYLQPGALAAICTAADRHPRAVLYHGDAWRVDAGGKRIGVSRSNDLTWEIMRSGRGRTVQPGSFYRRDALERAGNVDGSFFLLMDVDLWIRLLREGPAERIRQELASFRVHADAKSSSGSVRRYYRETLRLGLRHERDRVARALLVRSARIARFHVGWLGRKAWAFIRS